MISVSLSCSVKAANGRMPETVYPHSAQVFTWYVNQCLLLHLMSEDVFVCVTAIQIITLY